MNMRTNWIAGVLALGLSLCAAAQQTQRQPRVEAQKTKAADSWTLGDQTWDFRDILAAYEPVKGHIESRNGGGDLAVWKLRLVRDLEEGAARLHEEMRGSPFKIVLFDAERIVVNPDLPATITPVPVRTDDVIELYVALPERQLLRDVKTIRIQRRTDVGF
jgi:hypothetical protein